MSILRYRAQWSGWAGGPGVSTFIALGTDAPAFAAGVRDLFLSSLGSGVSSVLAGGCQIAYDPFVEQVDEVTGFLESTIPVTPPATLTSPTLSAFASPAGVCITWLTGGINPNGHRIRGRTFLVPLKATEFDNFGTLSDTRKTTIQTAATTYANGAWDPAIWSRPDPGLSNGGAVAVQAAVVRDKVALLTSRRD